MHSAWKISVWIIVFVFCLSISLIANAENFQFNLHADSAPFLSGEVDPQKGCWVKFGTIEVPPQKALVFDAKGTICLQCGSFDERSGNCLACAEKESRRPEATAAEKGGLLIRVNGSQYDYTTQKRTDIFHSEKNTQASVEVCVDMEGRNRSASLWKYSLRVSVDSGSRIPINNLGETKK